MPTDLVNIGLGFLEGFGLIISPCILPILPILLSGSLTGSKRRPYGIVSGFIVVFALVTFFSRQLIQYLGVSFESLRYLSFGLLIWLGIIIMSESLTESFARLTQRLTRVGSSIAIINQSEGGFLGGLLFGSLIALIWTPCAGPILAAVIVQIAIQQTNLISFFILLAFSVGAALPMLLIIICGRKIMAKFVFFKSHASLFRKILGAIIIASVIYMSLGGTYAVSSSDNQNQLDITGIQHGIASPYLAPPISGINAWINSAPLQLNQLKGKVVLIDFWTYSCINCIRTLPYLKEWYAKYHDKGLVIIGVHSPEFPFEKELANVKSAVSKEGILYPVALDNEFVTWRNYQNRYWPAHYLINKNGFVVYQHFGEGSYDITENNIRALLGEKDLPLSAEQKQEWNAYQTPETYFGYARADNFASPDGFVRDRMAEYVFPQELAKDAWALQGAWAVKYDKIVAGKQNAALKVHFNARKVFVVMGNTTPYAIDVKIRLNGRPVTVMSGKNVVNSSVRVDKHQLYEVIAFPRAQEGYLELMTTAPGLEMYTFTFG